MLRIDNLSAWYGQARVLREVSLDVSAGEVVTLVGRNGAGKSTLLRCVMGLHPGRSGVIALDGRDVSRLPAHRRARLGLGWVPDDRGSYATLTVTENLTLPPRVGPDPWPLERVYEAFPALYDRRASAATMLSGGEQQMLALARVLRMGARLLLCDEPTEGLSPLLVRQVADLLRQAKRHGVTVLLVEQNLHFATGVADRHYLLAEGRIAEAMDNSEVRSRERELLAYLGI
ncbi:High-affinity branched-chain amino acid transport ATP-binding protein LivF [Micromonospora sp. MW-13]|uniref:ABC transporter ATP-binding protein n=1 Tax=unclassified Micromonospora TaxID=2617518 RepID=UPI000E450B94|nr:MULTISPECIES: ABC transporter ATP-binding protein [unclassified Micromonospora]MCX4473236.1 ABC transporter ATP-binding protein [Micromonospora sp. NBC_01655]RGC67525.1 High-affinity branched-chain amino acid transport ATP-binding protein LivF [Micromonospora sp. MW-13]